MNKYKKRRLLLPVILLVLCLSSAVWVSAAETDVSQESAQEKNDPKAPGWHTKANGKKYYIKKDGKKAESRYGNGTSVYQKGRQKSRRLDKDPGKILLL